MGASPSPKGVPISPLGKAALQVAFRKTTGWIPTGIDAGLDVNYEWGRNVLEGFSPRPLIAVAIAPELSRGQ